MEQMKKPNHCIACTVAQCAHHADTTDYCVLEKITVGTHEKNPTKVECVDCESFVLSAEKAKNCAGGTCSK